MAADPTYRTLSPDELRALTKDRAFTGLLFANGLALDGLDLTESGSSAVSSRGR